MRIGYKQENRQRSGLYADVMLTSQPATRTLQLQTRELVAKAASSLQKNSTAEKSVANSVETEKHTVASNTSFFISGKTSPSPE